MPSPSAPGTALTSPMLRSSPYAPYFSLKSSSYSPLFLCTSGSQYCFCHIMHCSLHEVLLRKASNMSIGLDKYRGKDWNDKHGGVCMYVCGTQKQSCTGGCMFLYGSIIFCLTDAYA